MLEEKKSVEDVPTKEPVKKQTPAEIRKANEELERTRKERID